MTDSLFAPQRSTTEPATRADLYRDQRLVVLALWQPWATLVVAPDPTNNNEPPKRHETRHWRPKDSELPLYCAVHAAKRYDGEVRYSLGLPRFRAAIDRVGYYDPNQETKLRSLDARPLTFGGIIGLAVVTGIYATRVLTRESSLGIPETPNEIAKHLTQLTEDDKTFGNWEPGRWAWRLEHTILLPEPVEHTGRQQVLYAVDDATRAAIFAQLP